MEEYFSVNDEENMIDVYLLLLFQCYKVYYLLMISYQHLLLILIYVIYYYLIISYLLQIK